MDCNQMKKPAKSAVKSKRKKNNPKKYDVGSSSSICDSKTPSSSTPRPKLSTKTEKNIKMKKQAKSAVESKRKKNNPKKYDVGSSSSICDSKTLSSSTPRPKLSKNTEKNIKMEKQAKSAVESKRKKNNPKKNGVGSSSSICDNKTPSSSIPHPKLSTNTETKIKMKKQAKSVVESKRKKNNPKQYDVGCSSSISDSKTPSSSTPRPKLSRNTDTKIKRKQPAKSVVASKRKKNNPEKDDFASSSSICDSKTPSSSTPRPKLSTNSGTKICSFYKVTEDESGKPVFSKALLKYFMKVDSPEMDDLKNKRFNTSFLHETPKPNRVIKFYTEEEEKDPQYFPDLPDIESNLPDVPGSLHTDVFKSIPGNDSDEELKKAFKEMANGKKKRRGRNPGYSGKPLPDEALGFNYDGLFD